MEKNKIQRPISYLSPLKRCSRCKKFKYRKSFTSGPRDRPGDYNYCKICEKKRKAEYRVRNESKILAYQRKYRIENRERMNELSRIWNHKNKRVVMEYYCGGSPRCQCPSDKCAEIYMEFLSIDHIDGGGTSHRKKIKNPGGASMYRWLIKSNFPKGFRILCMNCNTSLGFWGYCPHEKQ